MIFLLAFLGALVAFLTICALVYTYVRHRLFPRLEVWVTKQAGASLLKQSGIDPPPFGACPTCRGAFRAIEVPTIVNVNVCEEHGRCDGCPLVLDQYEAIAREQGLETMEPFEIAELERLRLRFPMEKRP